MWVNTTGSLCKLDLGQQGAKVTGSLVMWGLTSIAEMVFTDSSSHRRIGGCPLELMKPLHSTLKHSVVGSVWFCGL